MTVQDRTRLIGLLIITMKNTSLQAGVFLVIDCFFVMSIAEFINAKIRMVLYDTG